MPLGTGDFESVSYSDASFPSAPRVPHFNQSAPPRSGYGGDGGNYPAHYSSAPAAPNSLSPVAMVTSNNAAATGPQRAQETSVIRTRPSIKTGMSILLAGALIGGVVGITMHARQNAADAAFAAQVAANPTSTPSPIASNPGGPSVLPQGPPGLPPQALANNTPQPGMTVIIPPNQALAIGKDGKDAKDAKDKDTKDSKRASHGFAKSGGGGHAATQAQPKVATPSMKKESGKDKDKDDGWTVASAGGDSAPAAREPKETKPEKPEPKEAKAEKLEPKEAKAEKPEPKATAKKGGASKAPDDANAVLKAAMGATENTL
jgi:hypothetical protein